MASLLSYYKSHPLRSILFVALLFRMIAAIFSRGYAFADDHFLVIEVAQQWVDGLNEKNWMPWNGNPTPSGHSLFYPGLHYYLFLFFQLIGIMDPETKMLLVRIIHALYSLLIVFYGYKIADKIGGKNVAVQTGWFLALLWFLPMFSVRNLVEMVCIPPLLIATWLVISANEKTSLWHYVFAGIIAGIGFSVRFQTALYFAGFGIAFLFQKKWKEGILFGTGNVISMIAIQGGIDFFIWGKPFAEFFAYTDYNLKHSGEYPNLPWYSLPTLLLGLFIPPMSLMLGAGMIKSFKKYLLLILPSLLFFLFHAWFPNKQERFILPVIPFFLIAGLAGWQDFLNTTVKKAAWQKFSNIAWKWIWTINLILVLVLTPSSTRISRVDVLNYLREKGDVNYYVLETTHKWGSVMLPHFYFGKWLRGYNITQKKNADFLFDSLRTEHLPLPDYVIFAEAKDLEQRKESVKIHAKDLVFEKEVQSSYLDRTMTFLNPMNTNQTYYVYKIIY